MQDPWISQIRKGLVEFCILAVLRQKEEYGYAILKKLRGIHGLALTESTIYPALARMKQDGLLSSRTIPSSSGPSRLYYALTAEGRSRLSDMIVYWRAIQSGIRGLLGDAGENA